MREQRSSLAPHLVIVVVVVWSTLTAELDDAPLQGITRATITTTIPKVVIGLTFLQQTVCLSGLAGSLARCDLIIGKASSALLVRSLVIEVSLASVDYCIK